MHISEGVLSTPVLVGGGLICAGLTAIGLKNIKDEDIPKVAVLTATFFVASLIHIPLGPSSVHLILNGLMGLILGIAAFPAILIALFFQAILFQFGGLTVLGVNTINMAFPAIVIYYLCKPMVGSGKRGLNMIGGFIAGAGAVFGAGMLVALSLYLSNKGFISAAKMVILAHVPIMIIEGIITAIAVSFIKKLRPELIISLIILVLIPSYGFCHRINIFCYVDGASIRCEARFTPGGPVKNGEIIVRSVQTKEILLKANTNEKGEVSFRIPKKAIDNHWDLKVICNAEMGHRNFWIIKADELPQKEETAPVPEKKDIEKTPQKIGISKRELEIVISKIIRKELAPVKRDIAELSEHKISFQDIIAGLGYIFGLAGIALYFMSKKKRL
ncbi:MAG: cobalt transporter CbiM [Deltaproteobacteria bacterium]|nr:MAG: cobalt transporter CbiM [Deltaproteobacteria bacterium]